MEDSSNVFRPPSQEDGYSQLLREFHPKDEPIESDLDEILRMTFGDVDFHPTKMDPHSIAQFFLDQQSMDIDNNSNCCQVNCCQPSLVQGIMERMRTLCERMETETSTWYDTWRRIPHRNRDIIFCKASHGLGATLEHFYSIKSLHEGLFYSAEFSPLQCIDANSFLKRMTNCIRSLEFMRSCVSMTSTKSVTSPWAWIDSVPSSIMLNKAKGEKKMMFTVRMKLLVPACKILKGIKTPSLSFKNAHTDKIIDTGVVTVTFLYLSFFSQSLSQTETREASSTEYIYDVQCTVGKCTRAEATFILPYTTVLLEDRILVPHPFQSFIRATETQVETIAWNSDPIIILSNNNQFAAAWLKMIRLKVFGLQSKQEADVTVDWHRFANIFQTMFMDLMCNASENKNFRILTRQEMDYIHNVANKRGTTLSDSQCRDMWKKIAGLINSCRFRRYFARFWHDGLFFPFCSEEMAEQILIHMAKMGHSDAIMFRGHEESPDKAIYISYIRSGSTTVKRSDVRDVEWNDKSKGFYRFLMESPWIKWIVKMKVKPTEIQNGEHPVKDVEGIRRYTEEAFQMPLIQMVSAMDIQTFYNMKKNEKEQTVEETEVVKTEYVPFPKS